MTMSMSQVQYEQIVPRLESKDAVLEVALETGFLYDTLLTIFVQLNTRFSKRPSHKPNLGKIRARFRAGAKIVDIARELDDSPFLLARALVSQQCEGQHVKAMTRKLISNPSLIQDEQLRGQLVECFEGDDLYSPLSERIKSFHGAEHELMLQENLHYLGIPFKVERNLRDEKFHKTPDVYLNMPICTRNQALVELGGLTDESGGAGIDGQFYWWIESKASFGDEEIFKQNKEQQLNHYVDRFKAGIVIYWFGFVYEINTEPNILVFDHFPIELIEFRKDPRTLNG